MQGTTPLANKLVTFSLSNAALASFDTDISTISTNAEGQAFIKLLAGTSSGSGSISATVEGSDAISSQAVIFDSAGDGGIIAETMTVLLTISDKNVAQATPAILTATVMLGNTLMANKLVKFTIDNNALASFETDVSTRSTDAAGQAVIKLIAGASSGSGQVLASVDGINATPVVFDSAGDGGGTGVIYACLLYTSPSPRD